MSFTVDQAYDLVSSAHDRGRLSHAFLITGPRDCGKDALAARMADLLNGKKSGGDADLWGDPVETSTPTIQSVESDYVRIVRPRSKSRQISVDEMRSVEKMMNQSAPSDTWKIGIIIDADRMNESAENAFLKTLEEPPPRSLLLLLSPEPQRLLPTIWSRCVHLPLHNETSNPLSPDVLELIPYLEKATREKFASLEIGLSLKAAFETLLANCKARIAKEHTAAYKAEAEQYKNAIEGNWLEQREKAYEAMTSAEYLGERIRFVEALLSWLGDILRQKASATGLEFPDHAALTKEAADQLSLENILDRITAIEDLRRLLETNVTEALALEVSFMKAFGSAS